MVQFLPVDPCKSSTYDSQGGEKGAKWRRKSAKKFRLFNHGLQDYTDRVFEQKQTKRTKIVSHQSTQIDTNLKRAGELAGGFAQEDAELTEVRGQRSDVSGQ